MEVVAVVPSRRSSVAVRKAEPDRPDREPVVAASVVDVDEALPMPVPTDFETVFGMHHARLLRIAGLLCGDAQEAEDVVAEVFARTFRRWQKGGIDDVGAYLRRGVVNEVRSRWRKRSVRRRVDARRTRDADEVAPAADVDIGEGARLQHALAQLTERQRAAIVLRFYDDRSEADTAAVLDVPIGTVKSSVSRGLARLAELLGEPGGEA
jgi:RNA polymerase sigma-70 factor (sigma-E family)